MKKNMYVIVRCRNAGVHAGEYVSHKGEEVTLKNSRRIWYWSGACSLSQLSQDGAHSESKIAVEVPSIVLLDACEIIPCSKKAEKWLREVTPWKK